MPTQRQPTRLSNRKLLARSLFPVAQCQTTTPPPPPVALNDSCSLSRRHTVHQSSHILSVWIYIRAREPQPVEQPARRRRRKDKHQLTNPLCSYQAQNQHPTPGATLVLRGMAEKITEDQVDDLLKILRSEASIDTKVQHVTGIKSGIKQHNVPDVLIPLIFDGLRTASVSQHAVLVNAGFTALNHLLTRLSRQEPKYIAKEAKHTLPLVIDKLGDQKEKFRSLASQALTTIYSAAPIDVERSVRNVAMIGKNPRAKEAGMHWLLHMHQEQGMQFRAYVPTLMELLEDADGMVRDVAKTTVIELFQYVASGRRTSSIKCALIVA